MADSAKAHSLGWMGETEEAVRYAVRLIRPARTTSACDMGSTQVDIMQRRHGRPSGALANFEEGGKPRLAIPPLIHPGNQNAGQSQLMLALDRNLAC
jgi:hypothetical protein